MKPNFTHVVFEAARVAVYVRVRDAQAFSLDNPAWSIVSAYEDSDPRNAVPARAKYAPGTLRMTRIVVGAYEAEIWNEKPSPVHPIENIGSVMPSTTARPLGEILKD